MPLNPIQLVYGHLIDPCRRRILVEKVGPSVAIPNIGFIGGIMQLRIGNVGWVPVFLFGLFLLTTLTNCAKDKGELDRALNEDSVGYSDVPNAKDWLGPDGANGGGKTTLDPIVTNNEEPANGPSDGDFLVDAQNSDSSGLLDGDAMSTLDSIIRDQLNRLSEREKSKQSEIAQAILQLLAQAKAADEAREQRQAIAELIMNMIIGKNCSVWAKQQRTQAKKAGKPITPKMTTLYCFVQSKKNLISTIKQLAKNVTKDAVVMLFGVLQSQVK